jgi:hypothetical protein
MSQLNDERCVKCRHPLEGVLYGDSTRPNFFDDPEVLSLVGWVAEAITKYLDLRET